MSVVEQDLAVPELRIRPLAEADLPSVVAIESASYPYPWTEGIFRDCLRVGYICRAVQIGYALVGYGILSVGAGEAHVLNLCVTGDFRCRGVGARLLRHLLQVAVSTVPARHSLRCDPQTRRPCACTNPAVSCRWACGVATTRRRLGARTRWF